MNLKFLLSRSRVALLTFTLTAVILAVLVLGRALAAPAAGYTLDWWTVDAGGGSSAAGAYQLSGAVAQPEGGTLSGGNYRMQGGFWQEASQQGATFSIHLPLVVR